MTATANGRRPPPKYVGLAANLVARFGAPVSARFQVCRAAAAPPGNKTAGDGGAPSPLTCAMVDNPFQGFLGAASGSRTHDRQVTNLLLYH